MMHLNYLDKEISIFFIKSTDIEGRLDPYYYNSALQDFTTSQKYEVFKIQEVVQSFISGFGVGRQDQADVNSGIIQIRPTNLSQDGLLIFERNVYISSKLIKHNGLLLEKGDVIFNNTNSQEWVGKSAYYDLEKRLAFSNHITVLKANTSLILPKYLWIILNLYQQKKVFFSICTNWNNQSGVGIEVLKSLKIPVPSLSEQEIIIATYEDGLKRKKKLEEDAANIFKEAKKQVEEMILKL